MIYYNLTDIEKDTILEIDLPDDSGLSYQIEMCYKVLESYWLFRLTINNNGINVDTGWRKVVKTKSLVLEYKNVLPMNVGIEGYADLEPTEEDSFEYNELAPAEYNKDKFRLFLSSWEDLNDMITYSVKGSI